MFAIKSCLDINIFDEKGKKVMDLDICNDAEIIFYKKYNPKEDVLEKKCLLMLSHELNSFDLIELKNGTYEDKSDFDKIIGDVEISFGEDINDRRYKMIGTFLIRTEDNKDKEVKLVFNNVNFADICDCEEDILKFSCENVSSFSTVFNINLDENKKFFTMKSSI